MRRRNREVFRRLERLGGAPVPVPDDAMVRRLESRLRALADDDGFSATFAASAGRSTQDPAAHDAAAHDPAAQDPAVQDPAVQDSAVHDSGARPLVGALAGVGAVRPLAGAGSRLASPARVPGVAWVTAAVIVVAVMVGGLALQPDAGTPLQVALAGASDATAVLPDGTEMPLSGDLLVPDGTEIRTGPAGRVNIGGVTVGPNQRLRLSGGAVSRLDPCDFVVGGSCGEDGRSDQAGRAASGPTQGAATGGADGSPGDAPSSEAGQETPAISTTTTVVDPVELALAAQRKRTGVQLVWSTYDGDGFDSYLIVKGTIDRAESRWMPSSVEAIGRVTDRDATRYTDRTEADDNDLDPDIAVYYRILVLDDSGEEIAGSDVARPSARPRPDPTTTTTVSPATTSTTVRPTTTTTTPSTTSTTARPTTTTSSTSSTTKPPTTTSTVPGDGIGDAP